MIVGVAIKIGDNIEIRLPKPNRHCDCFWYFEKVTGKCASEIGRTGGKNQGFYTDKGVYLDRVQASRHVFRCKQELTPLKEGDCRNRNTGLFSEDLW
jgi:hypothetical protein